MHRRGGGPATSRQAAPPQDEPQGRPTRAEGGGGKVGRRGGVGSGEQLDEIEPAQVGIGLGELLKLLLMTKQAENFDQGPGQDGTFVPEIRVTILDKGFDIEHRVLRDVAVNPSSAV